MSGKQIVIVDYEMGNKRSILNALAYLGYRATVSKDAQTIQNADALILPGVGAFKDAMENIRRLLLQAPLEDAVLKKKTPLFGICLGMQILAQEGFEGGKTKGLGFIDATVEPLGSLHVGFNAIEILQKEPLYTTIEEDTHFYFDHSYHMVAPIENISARTLYHDKLVCASIQKENIFATQFHPEKSQRAGLKLLRNFLNYMENYNG